MFSLISLFFSHSFKLLSDLVEFHVKSSIKLFDISIANIITLDSIKYMRDLKLKSPVIINSFIKVFFYEHVLDKFKFQQTEIWRNVF